MEGQNSGSVEPLLITDQEFNDWVTRHRESVEKPHNIHLVVESNDAMTGTYAMLDARCRFYNNVQGGHVYGPSLLEVGVADAWREACRGGGFRQDAFMERGAVHDWGQGGVELGQQLASLSMSAANLKGDQLV